MWWRITLPTAQPDDIAAELMQAGAEGCEVREREVVAFVRGSREAAEAVLSELDASQRAVAMLSEEGTDDWLSHVQHLWQPRRIGCFQIIPALETNTSKPMGECDGVPVVLRPGAAFGTGEHVTTEMILEYLSEILREELPLQRGLDVGTGSGILAIAMARRMKILVDAVETDNDALRNAKENLELNGLSSEVHLALGSLPAPRPPYGIVVANLYAELLIQLSKELQSSVAPGGYLILSGIMSSLLNDVRDSFLTDTFKLVKAASRNSWECLALRRCR